MIGFIDIFVILFDGDYNKFIHYKIFGLIEIYFAKKKIYWIGELIFLFGQGETSFGKFIDLILGKCTWWITRKGKERLVPKKGINSSRIFSKWLLYSLSSKVPKFSLKDTYKYFENHQKKVNSTSKHMFSIPFNFRFTQTLVLIKNTK